MKLHVASELPFSREIVFRTYRDRLVELVPFLPNIRGIEERSRETTPPITRIVNIWRGGGDIPAAARAFISDKMLTWTDNASWDESRWVCHWRMETHAFREAVHAEGDNIFTVVDLPGRPEGGCRLTVEGDLTIDGKKLPIPRFLAGSVGPAVERFLVAAIRPNLTETARGVESFLVAEAAKAK